MTRLGGTAVLVLACALPACGGSKAKMGSRGGAGGAAGAAGSTAGAAGGIAGAAGSAAGTTGSAGTTGNAGTTGSAGTTGNAGITGSAGTAGNAGTTGSAGTVGGAGTAGGAGTTGTAGTSGTGGAGGGVACGSKQSPPGGAGGASGNPVTSCIAWRPKSSAWSSVQTGTPANIGALWSQMPNALHPSADGQQVYSVAIWMEDGHPRRQIVRSPDLGATWCLIPTAAPIADVMPAPSSPAVLYALTTASAAGKRDILRSRDGGATWATARGGLPEAVADADRSPTLSVAADADVVWFQGASALHLSRDGADTWSTVAFPKPTDPSDSFVGPVTVDLVTPRRLLAFGLRPPLSVVPLKPFLFISTDWGATWSEHALPAPADPDTLNSYQFEIDQSSTLYFGQSTSADPPGTYPVWRSTNWGGTWTPMPGTGGGMPMTLGSRVAGALFDYQQSGLFRSRDGGATWAAMTLPPDTQMLVAVAPDRIIARAGLSLARSTDAGVSWVVDGPVWEGDDPVVAARVAPYPLWVSRAGLQSDDGTRWVSTLASSSQVLPDGADANVAYASGVSGLGLAKTVDRGRTWQALSPPMGPGGTLLATCPPPRSCLYVQQGTGPTPVMVRSDDRGQTWRAPTEVTNWDTSSPIVVSPAEPDLLLQGRSGGMYQTRDGGGTWVYTPISTDAIVGVAFLSGSQVVAVTNRRQLVRSADGGDSWTVVSPNPMPAGSTRGLVGSASHPNTLFVLTGDVTVPMFRSDDGGLTWTAQPALGDGVQDLYGRPFVRDVVDIGCGYLANIQGYGLVRFD